MGNRRGEDEFGTSREAAVARDRALLLLNQKPRAREFHLILISPRSLPPQASRGRASN
jgi:hypothetical protein